MDMLPPVTPEEISRKGRRGIEKEKKSPENTKEVCSRKVN
jgi:hypothetical protein